MSASASAPAAASVLLVDDDPRNLRLLDTVLGPLGVRLVAATSGAQAVAYARENDFAVILLDVQMPLMDGFETAARLKRMPRSRATPILFLTAAIADSTVVKAYARGAVDYITKPFDPDILRSKVTVFVDLFLAKEEVRRQAAMLSERERTGLLARERAARTEADRQVERLRILADAGAALAISLDRDVILSALAATLVPGLCDACRFDVPFEGVPGEWSEREPALYVSDADLAAEDAPRRDLLRSLGMSSAIVVPMRAHGETMGMMMLVTSVKGRPLYTAQDLRFAEGIAMRAAIGLLNARLHGEARDAIRLRDDFLSVASHELRTPLTSLRLTVEGLQRSGGLNERMSQKLATAERQIGRLTDLIGQLLDVSRLVGGPLHLEAEEVDLSVLVVDVLDRFHDQLTRSGSTFERYLTPGAVGRWDVLRVEQVVTNLVSNAIKYGQGKPIEITTEVTADRVSVIVQDHGIGIAAADQARIFGRFERAVSIRHYGGFGLGLWITRQIVEALGGTIRVDSHEGVGALFRVELPRAPAARRSTLPPPVVL